MEADIEEFRSGAGGKGSNGREHMMPFVITHDAHMGTRGKRENGAESDGGEMRSVSGADGEACGERGSIERRRDGGQDMAC